MTLNARKSLPPETPCDVIAGADAREQGRTAMFVAAACVFRDQVHPVRIRNMAASGVLLEGDKLPPERTQFQLVRGSLHVQARSMWTYGKQCGAALLEPVDVVRWMARAVPAHQQRVDAMVHEARRAIAAGRQANNGDAEPVRPPNANIETAIGLLEALENALSEDGLVVARHMERLQSLDRALQLLRVAAGRPA